MDSRIQPVLKVVDDLLEESMRAVGAADMVERSYDRSRDIPHIRLVSVVEEE
jgi:hypothetical protein